MTRYYQLAAPTAATPTPPTSADALGGWTETEPDADVTKVLYTCERTVFSDGTEGWSKVSRSTSYEAAKDASSAAAAAKSTADSLATMIRDDSTGITVGKSADGTTYAEGTSITRQGTDGTFSIFKVLGGALVRVASFGEAVVSMCRGRIGIYANADGEASIGVFGTTTPSLMGGAYLSRDAAHLTGVTLTDPTVGAMGVGKDNSGNVTAFMCAQQLDVYGPLGKPTNVDMDRFATAIQPVVLFDKWDNPLNAGCTLSETAAHFVRMLIEYKTDDGHKGSTMVTPVTGATSVDGQILDLTCNVYNKNMYVKSKAVQISGTTINTYNSTGHSDGWWTGLWSVQDGTVLGDYITIVKVTGWR